MKKFLTVLLVIAVMFTFSFSSAFAADLTNEQATDNSTMDTEKDPFASFGEQIEISDNDLPF